MKNNSISISEAIKAILKIYRLDRKRAELQVKDLWPEVVGPMFARYTHRLEFRDGILFATIHSAAARSELQMARTKLKEVLNREMGSEIVKDIVLK